MGLNQAKDLPVAPSSANVHYFSLDDFLTIDDLCIKEVENLAKVDVMDNLVLS